MVITQDTIVEQVQYNPTCIVSKEKNNHIRSLQLQDRFLIPTVEKYIRHECHTVGLSFLVRETPLFF